MDKLCLSVTETAEQLGISRSRAYELVQQGWIPSIKCGRRVLIPLHALQKRLEELIAGSEDQNPALLS
jgi:excisionase family DNA binding protein